MIKVSKPGRERVLVFLRCAWLAFLEREEKRSAVFYGNVMRAGVPEIKQNNRYEFDKRLPG